MYYEDGQDDRALAKWIINVSAIYNEVLKEFDTGVQGTDGSG